MKIHNLRFKKETTAHQYCIVSYLTFTRFPIFGAVQSRHTITDAWSKTRDAVVYLYICLRDTLIL